MPDYFSGKEIENLPRNQKSGMEDPNTYNPVFRFLSRREEKFRTEDLLEDVETINYPRFSDYKVGHILGALRDEYDLIEGDLDDGRYWWNPELQAEGSWEMVREELGELTKSPKV